MPVAAWSCRHFYIFRAKSITRYEILIPVFKLMRIILGIVKPILKFEDSSQSLSQLYLLALTASNLFRIYIPFDKNGGYWINIYIRYTL
jgi:hypothetical protein